MHRRPTLGGREAVRVLLAIIGASALLAGCGGDADPTSPEGVAASLEDAGYQVSEVKSVSVFKPTPETALAVEGESVPEGQVVGIEFQASSDDAAEIRKQYKNIDAPVEVRGSIVYSALAPVEQSDLDPVVAAATP